jgi:hypothetical protein
MSLLIERQIKSQLDMAEIESVIMKELGCENNRCAFLRSKQYIQFRVAALYHVSPEPISIFHEPIHLSLGKGPGGEKMVTVKLIYEPIYELTFTAPDAVEESPEKKQRH